MAVESGRYMETVGKIKQFLKVYLLLTRRSGWLSKGY